MAIEVKVPLLPESISDATVSTWHKKAGDRVSRDENIVDLETDKVMLEVPSLSDGILKEIIKPTGSTVQAQEIIAVIEAGDAANTAPQAAQTSKAAAQPAAAQSAPAQTSASAKMAPPLSPSARRAVAEHEVDVSNVAGTGKGGRIT